MLHRAKLSLGVTIDDTRHFSVTEDLPFNLNGLERAAIEFALRAAEGELVVASKLLGITRHSLRRRMVKHNIRSRCEPAATRR